MKKIFTVLVLALAVSLAFTGCASKKAKENGPKTYYVNLGSVMSTIEIGQEEKAINVTSALPDGAKPVAGEKVRVLWSFMSDKDIGTIYVNLGDYSEEYVLAEDVDADQSIFAAQTIPLELDVDGQLYVYISADADAVCEVSYADAK